jgi:hypothetical protein
MLLTSDKAVPTDATSVAAVVALFAEAFASSEIHNAPMHGAPDRVISNTGFKFLALE